MSLLVLAYPEISKEDFDWIQSIRKREDKLYYTVVDPHFTIVFPVDNIDKNIFINHVKEKSGSFSSFEFVLRCAVVVKSSIDDYTDVFLVPDEGNSQFIKMHDILYTGSLKDNLRLDIAFIPHIVVGNNTNSMVCKHLADELNSRNFCIQGRIKELTIISFINNKVIPLSKVVL